VTERLITARVVADRLGVSPETVLRWTRRGELPALRLPGGAIRYRPADLDAWLEQRSTSTSTADRGCQTPERTALVEPDATAL